MTDATATFSVSHRFSFESAHQLIGHPTCGMVHGHSYRGRIRVSASRLNEQGFVVDFGVLKSVTARYDHGEVLTQTAEQLAEEIGRAVLDAAGKQDNAGDVLKVKVVLRETPDGRTEWLWRRG